MGFMSNVLRHSSGVLRSRLILLLWVTSVWILPIPVAESRERHADSRRIAVNAVDSETPASSPLGAILLVAETRAQGSLRERLRERRETRSLARNREKDPLVPQEPNDWQVGRRITRERVQTWIEQLRDRIRAEIGDSDGARDLEIPRVPGGRTDSALPSTVAPPGNTWPPRPLVPTDQQLSAGVKDSSSSQLQQPEVIGPELVPPESPSAPPSAMKNAHPDSAVPFSTIESPPPTSLPGTTEKPVEDNRNQDSTGLDPGGEGVTSQPGATAASKPTGLSGLFSNVAQMFGTATSPRVEKPSKDESQENQENQAGSNQTADPQNVPASSKPRSTTGKTLAEIRKQILLKQSSKSAAPRQ